MDLVEKLKENIKKAKEKIEEFTVIEKEAKNYEENIKKRYELEIQEKKKTTTFQKILGFFKISNKK